MAYGLILTQPALWGFLKIFGLGAGLIKTNPIIKNLQWWIHPVWRTGSLLRQKVGIVPMEFVQKTIWALLPHVGRQSSHVIHVFYSTSIPNPTRPSQTPWTGSGSWMPLSQSRTRTITLTPKITKTCVIYGFGHKIGPNTSGCGKKCKAWQAVSGLSTWRSPRAWVVSEAHWTRSGKTWQMAWSSSSTTGALGQGVSH